MNVEFRQRSAGEFFQMLMRRKWLIALPILTMTAAIGYVVYKLPSVYESKTFLTVKPPVIPNTVVPTLSDTDISQRIDGMRQEVLSRSSLEPMIVKHNLFKLERNAGIPTERIIDKMVRNIDVQLQRGDDDKLAGFKIKYRDRSPEAARIVTAELASKFISSQVLEQQRGADKTQEFIDKQVKQKKELLDKLQLQRVEIMSQNIDSLPTSQQGLIAQLTNLAQKRNSLIKEKQGLILEKGRISDGIRSTNTRINTLETLVAREVRDAARSASRFEDTSAYGTLIGKKTELEARLKNYLTEYRGIHPKVIATRNEIAEVKRSLKNLEASAKRKETRATASSANRIEIQKRGIEREKVRLQGNLKRIEQQIASKQQEVVVTAGEISSIEVRINSVPGVKLLLESINSQISSAKGAYDEQIKNRNKSTLIVDRAKSAQGETIRVVDPANLPKSPVAPKRGLLTIFGAVIGAAIGLFLAGIFEIPRLFRIQNIEDAKHYTGLPLLASVPPLLTENEVSWQARSHWLKVLAGVAAAVGSIPIIIMVLQASRVFERVVS